MIFWLDLSFRELYLLDDLLQTHFTQYMALRVLLGDESSTIKKVFQLALQDFAVEVRPVNIGVDVVSVATAFKPDIIFVDVLLQKKNGYDVSAEVKQNDSLKGIPVVLMWSGFMELDEDKFQACMANAQLEKPFDVGALRKLVSDLVPRTQNQRLSQFLSFPKLPEMEEKKGAESEPPPLEEDFQQVPIPKMKNAQNAGADKFRLNLKPEELEPQHVPVAYDLPSEKIKINDIFKSEPQVPEEEADEFSIRDNKRTAKAPPLPAEASGDLEMEDLLEDGSPAPAPAKAQPAAPQAFGQLSAEQLEKIIREQSAEVIESVVWKVIPELATQIIERELNKLLKERDSHP